MSGHAPDLTHLVRDLVGGLSLGGRDEGASVGLLSPSVAGQPPEHCLRTCLKRDAGAPFEGACPFLLQAQQNRVDPTLLRDGRCPKGFRVAAQATTLGGSPGTLVTVEGRVPGGGLHVGPAALLNQLDSVGRLVQRFEQLLEENAGFANEVLQNYEQLNLIFELTQQIAQVTDAATIEELLVRRVARLLNAESTLLVDHDGAWRAFRGPAGEPIGPEAALLPLDAALGCAAGVRRNRQVIVTSADGRQVIAGPVLRLDERVDVVVTARAGGAPAFNSGDMMLMESVLAFGGQIISNTELHERMRRMSLEVTRALVAAIDKKDHYTSGHSERGGFLTRMTARELGVPPGQQQYMEWSGLLHDVGKIGIPEEILCKPGKLTPEEFDVIKQHPRMGFEILQPIASLGVVLDGVLYHHEYPDGSGYPEGLTGDRIPLVARIIHTADTFDALTSTRAYRKAYSIGRALEIMRADCGVRIDTEVFEAFLRAFERYRRETPEDFAVRFAGTHERETDDVAV